jgi:glucosamine-6-phosphate deaminase
MEDHLWHLCLKEQPMKLKCFGNRTELSQAAAVYGAELIRKAIREQGKARVIFATAASQLVFLEFLVRMPDIAWEAVEVFHLDEYVGLKSSHPGSFRHMLKEHLLAKTAVRKFHLIEGDAPDPLAAAQAVGRELASARIDVAFIGIGENGHLAFNDPPADFDTVEPYIVVALDHACRQQQVAEGWFQSLDDVPTHAISMSIRQILNSKEIVAIVPGKRKAQAVVACFEGEIGPNAPASALRWHPAATVFLDTESASLLDQDSLERC